MEENRKTLWFVISALVLLTLAIVVSPERITPEVFIDQGEAFFADFSDPNEATTLEVIGFDQETGEAVPFKVAFENGKWSIPSHYNYPADGKERLANTAAAIIEIKKDDYRSYVIADHEKFSVVDPLDETAGLEGRGQRITIKGKSGKVLADLIVGKEVENRPGFRFVRSPDQSRVYASKTDIDISTRFEDWIESDLLKLTNPQITKAIINDYTINERTHSVDKRDRLVLTRGADDKWAADKMKSSQQVDETKMRELLTSLVELKIVDVRPKPEGLSLSLKETSGDKTISRQDRLSLQSKGFYFSNDGQMLSNEGEMLVYTEDGVIYTLRFGEVVARPGANTEEGDITESRYLFVTTHFDSAAFPEPEKPATYDFNSKPDSLMTADDRRNRELAPKWGRWQLDFDKGDKLSDEHNRRFADWYYVISSKSFDDLRMRRNDLVVNKDNEEN